MAPDNNKEEGRRQVVEAIRLGQLQEVVDRIQADPGLIHHTDRVRQGRQAWGNSREDHPWQFQHQQAGGMSCWCNSKALLKLRMHASHLSAHSPHRPQLAGGQA